MSSFDVAAELKSQINDENDPARRNMLMLLLGVLEANIAGIDRLSKKIDDLSSDEKALRTAVLNGHESVHHAHHEWTGVQIARAKETEAIRTWALRRMESTCESACDWAEKKRLQEIEDEKAALDDAKADKRVARDAVIRQVMTVITSLAIGGIAAMTTLNWMSK